MQDSIKQDTQIKLTKQKEQLTEELTKQNEELTARIG